MGKDLRSFLKANHAHFGRGFLLLATVLVIVAMFPRQTHFRFEYQKGQPWLYDDVRAPYDFPLLKSEEELDKERESILKEIPFYFRKDTAVGMRKLIMFADRLANEIPGYRQEEDENALSEYSELFIVGAEILKQIYELGLADQLRLEKISENSTVLILSGNEYTETLAQQILSTASAEELISTYLSKYPKGQSETLKKILPELIEVNLHEDTELYDIHRSQELSEISPSRGLVRSNDPIIARGDIVDDRRFRLLQSFEATTSFKQYRGLRVWQVYFGHALITFLAVSLFFAFLYLFRPDIFSSNRKIFLMLIMIIGLVFIYTRVLHSGVVSHYIVPICILPIIIRTFFNTGTALFTLIVCLLIIGPVAPNGFEFIFLHFFAGTVAIFSILSMRKRSQLFLGALLIFLSYLIAYTGLSILYHGNFSGLQIADVGWFFTNAALTLFALPLIYIFEKLSGLLSDVSLMEMSDTNNTLLKELSQKAPGTFQHSIQVANLTEAAVQEIGGNALLARVGALYHDVGKTDKAIFFIENQGGSNNPHDDLPFEQSAEIIIGHVKKGVEMARKNRLPDQIIDFIRTHHGTTRVQYFYRQYLKHFPEGVLSADDFSYPGPKPFSKETAALMMADVTEAASRCMDEHDSESIDKLVENLIDTLIKEKQFEQCPITFNDVLKIKALFKKMLKSIYHVRVAY